MTSKQVTERKKELKEEEKKTGKKISIDYVETRASTLAVWLRDYGDEYGWEEVSATESQMSANIGQPTVVVWDSKSGKPGHISVVRPYDDYRTGTPEVKVSKTGVYIAQAGLNNYDYRPVEDGFSPKKLREVKYYTHK